MKQILAVSTPGIGCRLLSRRRRTVGLSLQQRGLARGFYLMTGYSLPILISYSLQRTSDIDDVVPANLITHLGVLQVVRPASQTLTVLQQLHLVAIGIDHQLKLLSGNAVPMVAHAVVARLHAIPHLVALLVDDGDMYHRHVWAEERLHVVSLRFGFQGDVEDTLAPALSRPALRLTQIVDSPPVGQSDDLVAIHLKEILSHGSHRSLALVELHPGETPTVAGEIHIPIIISLHVGNHG